MVAKKSSNVTVATSQFFSHAHTTLTYTHTHTHTHTQMPASALLLLLVGGISIASGDNHSIPSTPPDCSQATTPYASSLCSQKDMPRCVDSTLDRLARCGLLSLSTCKTPCGMDSNSTETQLLEDEDNIFGRSSPVNPTSCESLIGWQPVCDGFCCAPCVSALEDVANCLVTQVWNTTVTRSCEMSCPSHNNDTEKATDAMAPREGTRFSNNGRRQISMAYEFSDCFPYMKQDNFTGSSFDLTMQCVNDKFRYLVTTRSNGPQTNRASFPNNVGALVGFCVVVALLVLMVWRSTCPGSDSKNNKRTQVHPIDNVSQRSIRVVHDDDEEAGVVRRERT